MGGRYKSLILAGLINDLNILKEGKLAVVIQDQRDLWGNICDADLLIELLKGEKHISVNGNVKEHRIFEMASEYSYGYRNNGICSKKMPLKAILAQIELNEPLPVACYHKMAEIGPLDVYPHKTEVLDEGAYRVQIDKFESSFRELMLSDNQEFQQVYSKILAQIRLWGWCLPAKTDQVTDVSLYEHSRITSAIAACLYRYHVEYGWETVDNDSACRFKLITADFPGIQKYIFGIKSVGGVAKRLRARSFFIASMIKGVALQLLRCLELPLSNLLMSAGGKFWLLIPNTVNTEKRFNDVITQTEKWLLEKYYGQVSLVVGQTTMTGRDLSSFDEVSRRCSESLANAKLTVFRNLLTSENSWQTGEFLRPVTITESACPSCGKIDTAGGEVCEQCDRDQSLGAKLANASYIIYHQNQNSGSYPMLPSMQLSVTDSINEKIRDLILTDRINNPKLSKLHGPVSFNFMANHIPLLKDLSDQIKNSNQIATFEQIAEKAAGKKMLAYLKADVDNMGSAYIYGLRRDSGGAPITISRLATVSNMLDLFFGGVLNHLLTNQYRDCYTIFSGGDDLFVAGPWDRIIDLAIELVDEFKKFTGGNKNLTLSAGVLLAKDSYPIYSAYRDVEELLEKAKNEKALKKQKPKDQLAVFDGLIKWDELREARDTGRQLADWINQKVASAAFVKHLLTYGHMYRDYLDHDNIRGLRFLSLLCSDIARNLPSPGSPGNAGLYRAWAESLIHGLKVNERVFKNIWFIARYALTATRE